MKNVQRYKRALWTSGIVGLASLGLLTLACGSPPTGDASLAAVSEEAEPPLEEAAPQDSEEGRQELASLPRAATPSAELTPIASLDLGQSHVIEYFRGEEGDIYTMERAPLEKGLEPLLLDPQLSELEPLELYLQLAPRDQPVPAAFADSAVSPGSLRELELRGVTEERLGKLSVDLVQLRDSGWKPHVDDLIDWPELCHPSGGAALFRDQLCATARGNVECNSTMSPGPHTHSSGGSRVKNGRIAVIGCRGTGVQATLGAGGLADYSIDHPGQGQLLIWHAAGVAKRKRDGQAARAFNTSTSSGIRSVLAFYD